MKNSDNNMLAIRWSLDEKRRKVTELETLATGFRTKIDQLDRELEVAQETASVDPVRSLKIHEQVSQAVSRRNKLHLSLKMLESEMVKAIEEADEAHQKFRRFELIHSRDRLKAGLK